MMVVWQNDDIDHRMSHDVDVEIVTVERRRRHGSGIGKSYQEVEFGSHSIASHLKVPCTTLFRIRLMHPCVAFTLPRLQKRNR